MNKFNVYLLADLNSYTFKMQDNNVCENYLSLKFLRFTAVTSIKYFHVSANNLLRWINVRIV